MRIVRVAVAAGSWPCSGCWSGTSRTAEASGVAQKVDKGKVVPAPALDLPRLDGDGTPEPRVAPRQGRRR